MEGNRLTGEVIGAAIEIHRVLGPGLLKSAYEECMDYELKERGLQADRQVELPVLYKNKRLNAGYRIDLLVNGQLITQFQRAHHEAGDKTTFEWLSFLPLCTL